MGDPGELWRVIPHISPHRGVDRALLRLCRSIWYGYPELRGKELVRALANYVGGQFEVSGRAYSREHIPDDWIARRIAETPGWKSLAHVEGLEQRQEPKEAKKKKLVVLATNRKHWDEDLVTWHAVIDQGGTFYVARLRRNGKGLVIACGNMTAPLTGESAPVWSEVIWAGESTSFSPDVQKTLEDLFPLIVRVLNWVRMFGRYALNGTYWDNATYWDTEKLFVTDQSSMLKGLSARMITVENPAAWKRMQQICVAFRPYAETKELPPGTTPQIMRFLVVSAGIPGLWQQMDERDHRLGDVLLGYYAKGQSLTELAQCTEGVNDSTQVRRLLNKGMEYVFEHLPEQSEDFPLDKHREFDMKAMAEQRRERQRVAGKKAAEGKNTSEWGRRTVAQRWWPESGARHNGSGEE